ncbi:MAG: hypothetical protein IJE10_11640 [Clostridia bacterium]|nr:hypothetical protein [Clostridia bacterium]
MNNELNIAWMYPDILNLHGDRGNLMALDRVGKMMDVDVKIQKVERFSDAVPLENSDILFFNVGELKVMPEIIKALRKYESELKAFAEAGKTIILIGASAGIFAKKTVRKTETFEGFGILDIELKERDTIYGDDILYTLEENGMEIAGCQIKMFDTLLSAPELRLGTLYYGSGNAGYVNQTEGARYKNVIFTNALGPVLVKNPWFAEHIIRTALENKGVTVEKKLTDADFELELNSLKSIKEFVDKKGEKDVSGA